MSGGRYTKKVPEKIYFVVYDGEEYDKDCWVHGPYVNPPRGIKSPPLKTFKLVEENNVETKRESWKDFCDRKNIYEEMLGDVAVMAFYTSVYCVEQKLNPRRAILKIKKLIENQQNKK